VTADVKQAIDVVVPGDVAKPVETDFEEELYQLSDPGVTKSLFRNFPFLRLWTAQAISQTANNMVNFALLLRVREIIEHHDLRQANTLTSLEILAFSIPSVIFGPIAGVLADRFDRRLVMASVDFIRAACMILFLIISPTWQVQVILITTYLVTFIFGAAGQMFAPAEGATIPDLVPRSQLISANAMFNLTNTASQLIGFALLGTVLVKLFGVNAVFAITLALFILCAGLILTLPKTTRPRERSETVQGSQAVEKLWIDIREGLVFILRDPYLIKAILHLSIAAMTLQMLAALGPEFISSVLDLGSEDLLFIVGPAATGVFVGVLFVGRTTRSSERSSVIDWALALAGIMIICMVSAAGSLSNWFNASHNLVLTVTAVFAFGLGICNAFVLIPAQTMLQERSTEQVRARVYATFFTISNLLAFIPIVFAALLADVFGVVAVLIVIGLIIGAIGGQSVVRRRIDEHNRWMRPRRRQREGPETISPESGRRGRFWTRS
jgi:MFS family permease